MTEVVAPLTMTITTKAGPEQVRYLATETPGLVVTRTSFIDTGLHQLGLCALTHAPSGYAVIQALPSRHMAKLVARWLGQHGIDWMSPSEILLADEKAEKLVLPLRSQALEAVFAICDLADLADPPSVTRSKCVGRRRERVSA